MTEASSVQIIQCWITASINIPIKGHQWNGTRQQWNYVHCSDKIAIHDGGTFGQREAKVIYYTQEDVMIIQIFFLNLWEKNKSFFISQKFSKLCDGGKSAIVLRALASPLGGKNAAQHWSVFYVLLCLLFYSGELKFGGRFPFNIPKVH